MTRFFFALPLVLSIALLAAADPDKPGAGSVAGGASDSAGDAEKGEGHCPGKEERADEPPVDAEMPNQPMLWTFNSPQRSFLEAVCKLFKKFPGEVKDGGITKVKDEFVLEVRTLARTQKDHDKFTDWLMKKTSARREDNSWGCHTDEARIKEMEQARANAENQKKPSEKQDKKDAGKPAEPDPESCPDSKK